MRGVALASQNKAQEWGVHNMLNSAIQPRSATHVPSSRHKFTEDVPFRQRPSARLLSAPASDDWTDPPAYCSPCLPRQRSSEPASGQPDRQSGGNRDGSADLGHRIGLRSAAVRWIDRSHRSNQRGIAAVEFALVLPVLLLLLFGIIEFALAMYDKAVITNASREAARAGVVLKNPKRTTTEIQNVALNYCQNHLITLHGTAQPTVTVPSGQGGSFGTPLTVTVSYSYSGLALGAIIRPFTGPLLLTATSVMNNE
ncbi:TadE/TadG family type IV pilus assembly protein [uncultured Ralstonia sp.]|jgi:Flp pilus assembly protein TadG|uniref:TadE/TadG family type IV pilus assembly protein n=1 Tax=uncultured Ralstonia sp. TaxID=114715 RepID=UPI00341639E1